MIAPNQTVETNAHTAWPAEAIGFMMDSLQQCERRFQRIAHLIRSVKA